MRTRVLRLVLGLLVLALGLTEVQGLLNVLRTQARANERTVRGVREAVLAARPRLAAALAPGGSDAWALAAEDALRLSLAAEVEVLDVTGGLRLARPRPSPVRHWPRAEELRALERGGVLVVRPLPGEASRLLSYLVLASGDELLALRLSTPVAEMAEDLRERRQLLLGHGLALLLLVLIAAFCFLPSTRPEPPLPPRALGAYEEAMGRLRDRGQVLDREHEAERRRLTDAVRGAEAMARAGQLTAGVAHEVRNGLGTILGYARLIERGSSPEETVEAARHIRAECEVLETVVRRFVNYVKTEELHPAVFDLARTLGRVAAREGRKHPEAELRLDGPPECRVTGDEELLERAFENLVRNALEAGGSRGRVDIGWEAGADGARVRIADDGPGLPPDSPSMPRPFVSAKPGGLGLGLPLAHKIVRLHGGDLSLEPRTPRGTTATLWLPTAGPQS